MRYPVNNFKTEWNLTAGNPFGQPTSYGFHDGVDINDNGGGNSDLGKDIYAISNGELVYWHGAKHPKIGFGYHSVYKITGSFGTRWVHQAHCLSDLTPAVKTVSENEKIARVGNTGTTYAHIHFAILKVDPVTLPQGIDTIAKTQQQLNDWWEDPIKFIDNQITPPQPPITADEERALKILREAKIEFNHGNLEGTAAALRGAAQRLPQVENDLKNANARLVKISAWHKNFPQ